MERVGSIRRPGSAPVGVTSPRSTGGSSLPGPRSPDARPQAPQVEGAAGPVRVELLQQLRQPGIQSLVDHRIVQRPQLVARGAGASARRGPGRCDGHHPQGGRGPAAGGTGGGGTGGGSSRTVGAARWCSGWGMPPTSARHPRDGNHPPARSPVPGRTPSGVVLGREHLALLGQDGVGLVTGQLIRGTAGSARPKARASARVPAGRQGMAPPGEDLPGPAADRAQSSASIAAKSVPRPSSVRGAGRGLGPSGRR